LPKDTLVDNGCQGSLWLRHVIHIHECTLILETEFEFLSMKETKYVESVGIKSDHNAGEITAAHIDVNTAQVEISTAGELQGLYTKWLLLLIQELVLLRSFKEYFYVIKTVSTKLSTIGTKLLLSGKVKTAQRNTLSG
nr:hypothetical protein [Tanacetum cinerariifolium]